MKYLNKSFSIAGPNVTQAEWDRIFSKRVPDSRDPRQLLLPLTSTEERRD